MEKFKLDIYIKETGEVFSGIETLNSEERIEVLNVIKNITQLTTDNLFAELECKLPSVDYGDGHTYDLYSIFKDFNFDEKGNIIVIWDKDNIDRISAKILLKRWSYIWYGDSDEALILYNKQKGKLLLITHYGRIFYFDRDA